MNTRYEATRFYPLGDSAIVIQFGREINRHAHDMVNGVCAYLEEFSFEGFIEYVPAFTTVTIFYEPLIINYNELQSLLEEMLSDVLENPVQIEERTIEIPVLYGAEWGADLDFVAAYAKLSQEKVIELHTHAEYTVHMIGFAPGFPYLGGLNKQIAVPRKETPRLKIVAGSVGIAGNQTGVYPIETPGGWQIIGRTPIELFNVNRDMPALLRAGDKVRFVSVTEREFENIWREKRGN